MGTIANKLQLLEMNKAEIRAAIIEKGQAVSDSDPLSAYGDKIRAIQTGTDTSDATAGPGDILSGKTAYVDGGKVTGTIAARGSDDLEISGNVVVVPAGHYDRNASCALAVASQATPGISVSSGGLITASATQTAGYVAAGTKSATRQLTTQAAATITPGTAAKTAVASGRYTTGAVTVAGSANLLAANIKSGVNIFGVTGTYAGDITFLNGGTFTGGGGQTVPLEMTTSALANKVKIVLIGTMATTNLPQTGRFTLHWVYIKAASKDYLSSIFYSQGDIGWDDSTDYNSLTVSGTNIIAKAYFNFGSGVQYYWWAFG